MHFRRNRWSGSENPCSAFLRRYGDGRITHQAMRWFHRLTPGELKEGTYIAAAYDEKKWRESLSLETTELKNLSSRSIRITAGNGWGTTFEASDPILGESICPGRFRQHPQLKTVFFMRIDGFFAM